MFSIIKVCSIIAKSPTMDRSVIKNHGNSTVRIFLRQFFKKIYKYISSHPTNLQIVLKQALSIAYSKNVCEIPASILLFIKL